MFWCCGVEPLWFLTCFSRCLGVEGVNERWCLFICLFNISVERVRVRESLEFFVSRFYKGSWVARGGSRRRQWVVRGQWSSGVYGGVGLDSGGVREGCTALIKGRV